MVDWLLTETTIQCDAVKTNVTLIVNQDGKVHCTGYKRYFEKGAKSSVEEIESRGEKLGKELKCEGPECSRMNEYRNKLFSEE